MGVLSQYRTERLIERLLGEDDVNSRTAKEIVQRLGRDPADAIPALLERIPGAADAEFKHLLAALYKLLDDDTLEHFHPGLKSDNSRTLGATTRVLCSNRHYDPNRLVALFDDPDVATTTLIRILSEFPDRLDAEALLRHASRLGPADHNALFKVIESIADQSLIPHLMNRVTAADASMRSHVVQLLARFPSEKTCRVLQQSLEDESKSVRLAAIEGLARMDFKPDIAVLARLLRDPDLAIQAHAIDAIIRLGHPDTMNHLVPVLQDESEYVRRAAVEVLNDIADTSLISELLTVLRDQDWWVRERAADALSKIGGPRVVDAMLELIRSGDEFVRRTAVEVINSSRDPRAYDYLVAALADADWWVKERAIDALAALGDAKAVPALLEELDRDPRARATTLRALATLADERALPAVLERLNDSDGPVRLEALRALETLADSHNVTMICDEIEHAMGDATSAFRDNARVTLANIRALLASADGATADGEPGGATATLIARPGQAPERLPANTRLDLASLLPGTVLDNRYRYIERVGQGAFGTVLRFEDTTVNEEVILKFLNEHVATSDRATKRFIQELRYARRVTHPNVIRIYDFVQIGGIHAISMEYFPGYPLTREMLQGRPMRVDRALRLLREITFGMASAHKSEVVHRDLKPANILMNANDEVKIVDFGIAAAAAGGRSNDPELTQAGDFVGTPAYTSPEQIRGDQVDARTDIYSLGIVMYRMLGGRLPYQERDRKALLKRHLEGRAPPLQRLNTLMPDGLAGVIEKAMAVDAAQRHRSMTELRQDLERFTT